MLGTWGSFPVDTPRRFNVDTTSYLRWNDVVCLQVSSYLLIKKDFFLDAVSLKKSNLQSRIEI